MKPTMKICFPKNTCKNYHLNNNHNNNHNNKIINSNNSNK